MQRRLDDHARENNRMSKKLEEAESKHGELLSRQPEMMDKAFTLIMTEVWSVEPELVVPWVEKWVDKSATRFSYFLTRIKHIFLRFGAHISLHIFTKTFVSFHGVLEVPPKCLG